MSVRVRLTRVGSKKNPIWRLVVADQRSPRDGRFIETVGHYNPQTDPSTIAIDEDRLSHWLARGAQPTNTVRKLLKAHAAGPAAGAAQPAVAEEPPAEPEEPVSEPEAASPSAGEPEPAAAPEPLDTGDEPGGAEADPAAEASEPS